MVLEGIEDGTEAALISLDQSKRPSIGLTIGFWWLFWWLPDSNRSSADGLAWCIRTQRQGCRWTEGFRGRSRSSVLFDRAIPAPSPLPYVLALEPRLRRLRDGGTNPALRDVPFAGPLSARVSAFADDITVFVLDVEAVKKAVAEYEQFWKKRRFAAQCLEG